MSNRLHDTLAAVGYAKVLVTLAPYAIRDQAAHADLARQFQRPPQRALVPGVGSDPNELPGRVYPRLGLALGHVDRAGLAGLRTDRRVHDLALAPALSLIRPVGPSAAPQPDTSVDGCTWGVARMGARAAWDAGFRGAGVKVAHVDTGVDGAHPAFAGEAIAAFAEFGFDGVQTASATPRDTAEHGTHTAGTLVGRAIGPEGAFGMAPEAQLISALVIEGGQEADRIIAGLEWALGHEPRVLSMSVGIRDFTSDFQPVIDAVRARNVLPVIAVGNEGANSSRSPANYDNVLSVGSIDSAGQVADFSGSQTFDRADDPLVPDLVAPGVGVLSSTPNGGYGRLDGTSMATPHVAGLAALLACAAPDATADDLERAIYASCQAPPGMPAQRGNRGVPDAGRALAALGR